MERMDEILVLDEGQIRERGIHDQLLKARGLYHQMFNVLHATPPQDGATHQVAY